ncbi:MAG: hypothetical protein GY940_11185, partial [bacterium]|nr:hypothetical protein [bacterium]
EEVILKMIRRHESFRTSYELINGERVQRIHDNIDFHVELYSAGSGESIDAGPGEFSINAIFKHFIRPFSLESVPLIRVGLFTEPAPAAGYLMMVDVPHIASDGISQSIFIKDFMKIYDGEEPAPLNVQYKDYREWQERRVRSDEYKKQETFWLNTFNDTVPVLDLPTDFPRSRLDSFDGGHIRFHLSRDESEQLRKIVETRKVTLLMF